MKEQVTRMASDDPKFINVYYHRADLDGKCSGAIAFLYYGLQAKYHAVDYEDCPIDLDPDATLNLFLDFSPQGTPHDELPENLFVIDHHKTSIGLPGTIDTTKAACILTWKHFFGDPIPKAIEYIAAADTWQKDHPEWETHINPFCMALLTEGMDITSPAWLNIFINETMLPIIIRDGEIMLKCIRKMQAFLIQKQAFTFEFEGLKFLTVIGGEKGSHRFASIWDPKTHDAMMVIQFIDGNLWKYNLYANESDVDLAEIAKKYGGGGHKGAAGFFSTKLLTL